MKQLRKKPEDVSESRSQDGSQDNMVTGRSPYSKYQQAPESGLASSPWSSKSSGISLQYLEYDLFKYSQMPSKQM
jgi:hypothetical protein